MALSAVLMCAGLLSAQTSSLDDDDRVILALLSDLARKASADCQALDSQKAFQAAKARVEARLKVKHGLTIDQAVQSLTEKAK